MSFPESDDLTEEGDLGGIPESDDFTEEGDRGASPASSEQESATGKATGDSVRVTSGASFDSSACSEGDDKDECGSMTTPVTGPETSVAEESSDEGTPSGESLAPRSI